LAAKAAPRIAVDPLTLAVRGLMCERTSRNLVLQSSDLSASPWAGVGAGTSVTPAAAAGPDGTTTANSITLDAAAGSRVEQYTATLAGSTAHTVSCWLKGSGQVTLHFDDGLADYESAITLTSSWVRYTHTATTGASPTSGRIMLINRTGVAPASLHAWHAQLEEGISATSEIPTTSAEVERTGDGHVISDLTSIGYSAGACTWVFRAHKGPNTDCRLLASALFGAPNIGVYNGTPFVGLDGVLSQDAAAPISAEVDFAIAARFQAGNYAICVDGATPVVNTLATAPAVPTVAYLGGLGVNSFPIGRHLISVSYYARPLSDVELREATSA
ncbi:MAG: hypothetical protein AB7O72_04340, partial [Ramlibacter sp.]